MSLTSSGIAKGDQRNVEDVFGFALTFEADTFPLELGLAGFIAFLASLSAADDMFAPVLLK